MNTESLKKNYSAIILAAGRSERMGVPKFSLRFDDKFTFLERIAHMYYSYGCEEIVVVLNIEGADLLNNLKLQLPSNLRVALNNHPEWARFYSLKTGMKALENIAPAFVSNIDNPFVNHKILDKLAENIEMNDYAFPSFNGRGGHPFMISEKIVTNILDEQDENINMKDFLRRYKNIAIEADYDKVLLNINTPDDYMAAFNIKKK